MRIRFGGFVGGAGGAFLPLGLAHQLAVEQREGRLRGVGRIARRVGDVQKLPAERAHARAVLSFQRRGGQRVGAVQSEVDPVKAGFAMAFLKAAVLSAGAQHDQLARVKRPARVFLEQADGARGDQHDFMGVDDARGVDPGFARLEQSGVFIARGTGGRGFIHLGFSPVFCVFSYCAALSGLLYYGYGGAVQAL